MLVRSLVGFVCAALLLGVAGASSVSASVSCSVYKMFPSLDGCSGAPPYVNDTLSFFKPHAFVDGTLWQNEQTIGRPPQATWNVAGVDFPTGNRMDGPYSGGAFCDRSASRPCSHTPGAEKLIDAYTFNWATYGPDQTGCASVSVSAAGAIDCDMGSHTAIDFNGIDFSPLDADGVTQHCLGLYIHSPTAASGTIKLENSRSKQQYSLGCGSFPGTHPYPIWIVTKGKSYDVSILNNVVDGGAGGTFPLTPAAVINFTGNGSLTVKYNYFSQDPSKMITAGGCLGYDISYNIWHNLGYDVGAYGLPAHSEHTLTGPEAGCGAAPKNYYLNNLAWQDASLPDPQAVTFFATNIGNRAFGAAATTDGKIGLNVTIANIPTSPQAPGVNYSIVGALSGAQRGGAGGTAGNYAVGDILELRTMPTSCNATTKVRPRFLVTTVSGAAADQVVPWTGGVCGSMHQSTTTLNATNCVDHVNRATGSFSGHCNDPKADGAKVTVAWQKATISTGGIQLGASQVGDAPYQQIYDTLWLDYNLFFTGGYSPGAKPFYFGTNSVLGPQVICKKGNGDVAYNNHNWKLDNNTPIVLTVGNNFVSPNCTR